MVSSTVHALLGLAGWSVIPDLATRQILRVLHYISYNYFHIPPPLPQTPTYRKHYRYTFSVVVLGYLLYNLVQGARSMIPNFYQVLGVPPSVDENGLKNAFKQFAKKNHPDRPEVGPGGQEVFMMVRQMFEALKDPVVRFAYDRFGPDVLNWQQCSTTREYLRHGLMQSSGYHIVAFIGLQFWSTIGEPSPVAFWRYILFTSLFAAEITLLLSPSPAASVSTPLFTSAFPDPTAAPSHRTILHMLFPERIAYQHILFLHQLFMFLSVALSRVAPNLFPQEPKVGKGVAERLNTLAIVADRETSLMVHADLHSIHPLPPSPDSRPSLSKMRPYSNPSQEIMETLSKEMENMIIEANVKKDVGPIRSMWEGAIARARASLHGNTGAGTAAPKRSKNFWERDDVEAEETEVKLDSDTLPSPISSNGSPPKQREGEPSGSEGRGKYQVRLPSPRPSPPPQPGMERRDSSYVRARSMSC